MWVWLAAFLIARSFGGTQAHGQVVPDTVRTPADTAAVDTVLVPIPPEEVADDTIPAALSEAAESEAVVPVVPPFPDTRPVGWYAGRWNWTREQLSSIPGINLLEFLEQIPGIVRFRAGGFGRPAGLTTLAGAGGRLRVFLDGYEVDPLGVGASELEALALQDVSTIRVERTLAELRVDIETYRLHRSEPYSLVELGTGVPEVRLLRALFSRGVRQRSIVTGAFDIVSTGGVGISEDYSQSNALARFSHGFDDDTGVEAEWRRTAVDRKGSDFPRQFTRTDFVLRARRTLGERTVLEATAGRSTAEEEVDSIVPPRVQTTQGAVRAAYASERIGLEATVRGRHLGGDSAAPVPDLETGVRAVVRPFRGFRLEADSRTAAGDGLRTSYASVRGTLNPFGGLSVFGSATFGDRFVPYFLIKEVPQEDAFVDVQVARPLTSPVDGWRAGAEMATRFGTLGVAAFKAGESQAVPFGLEFDRGSPAVEVDPTFGAESYLRLLVPGTAGALRLEGWATYIQDWENRVYTPEAVARGALIFQDVYYNGQLEPDVRIEGTFRGAARVPETPGSPFDVSTEPYQTVNFSLALRIIDVRAFLYWENLLNNRTALDLPFAPPAFPRVVYGASWQFTN